ncbi:MAG: hypothetical protein WC822_01200 [Candidatus Paceibacterota bacterium]
MTDDEARYLARALYRIEGKLEDIERAQLADRRAVMERLDERLEDIEDEVSLFREALAQMKATDGKSKVF